MGAQAGGAVLDAVFQIGEAAAAFVPQGVQGAVAEQAAKGAFVLYLMAGEVFTFFVLKKIVVGHSFFPFFDFGRDNIPPLRWVCVY